jgi:hypothetical protein
MATLSLLKILWSLMACYPTSEINSSIPDEYIFSLKNYYVIESAILDGEDFSSLYQENQSFIKFYQIPQDTNIYMANIMEKAQTLSYGMITDFNKTSYQTSNKSVNAIKFKWHFANTYDEVIGIAQVIYYEAIVDGRYVFYTIILPNEYQSIILSGPVFEVDNEAVNE